MRIEFGYRTILIGFTLIFSQVANSATITINNGGDDNVGCTLREAVESINDGENVGGCSASGSYGTNDTVSTVGTAAVTLTMGEIIISKTTSILGSITNKTTIQGNNTFRLFRYSNPAVNSMLSGLRFTMGNDAVTSPADNLTIENCMFEGNVGVSGPAISSTGDYLTIRDTLIQNNTASSLGGGIHSTGDFLIIENVQFIGNSADTGGAGYLTGDSKSISKSTFTGNTASTAGGIYVLGNMSLISASTFNNNTATVSGGGAMQLLGDSIDVINSTITGNSALNSDPSTDLEGGGIYSLSDNLRIINSTIVNNKADGSGGGIRLNFNATEIRNSIIAGNVAPHGSEIFFEIDIVFEGNVLGTSLVAISDAMQKRISTQPVSISASNILATKESVHAALLAQIVAPLANNGGDTLTHALVSDSPAGNTADNSACLGALVNGLDQIDQVRPFGIACDIGAFESQVAMFDGDGDGVATGVDNCPLVANPDQLDSNNNGVGNLCEDDGFCFPIKAKNGKVALICL